MEKDYEIYTPEIPEEETGTAPVLTGESEQKSGGRGKKRREQPKSVSKAKGKPADKRGDDEVRKETTADLIAKIKPWCTSNNLHLVLGIVLGALGIWLAIAFIGYFSTCIKDQAIVNNSPVGQALHISNPAGEGGARISEFLINECFGLGSFVIVFWLLALSSRRLAGYPKFKPLGFTIKCLLALICISLIVGLLTLATHTPVNWGGYHGRYVNALIIDFIGWAGGVVFCVMWIAIFIVVCMRDLIKWILKKKKERDERLAEKAAMLAEEERNRREIEEMRKREAEELRASGEAVFPDSYEIADEAEEPLLFEHSEHEAEEKDIADSQSRFNEDAGPDLGTYSLPEEFEPEPINTFGKSDKRIAADPEPNDSRSAQSEEESKKSETEQAENVESGNRKEEMVVNVNNIALSKNASKTHDPSVVTYPYEFPGLDFLRPGTDKISVDAAEQLENKENIRKTLLDFGIPIVSIEATVGPTVTLYEIRPEAGVKISKIRNLVDDIALRLAAVGVRIIAPIPGKGTVGIEVANKDRQTVSMRTAIQSRKFQESKARLPIAIGSTISNEIFVADLAKMPHLLVAGATGQGKSVGMNAIITSLLYSKRPEELKLVMIDPKRVEFSLYSKIEAHYLAKIPDAEETIITKKENVIATLSSLCIEMEMRYDLLKNAGVRNIEEYNSKIKSGALNTLEGHKFLPYIVVIIDEFSDLIMTAGKEVETPIARLAQMARAVGMHVIIATQRPSTNVITGVIKANFPVRIAFKVSSGVDSKTILDTTGAQQLIGTGDMLISMNSETVRVQCAFVDTPEVEKICQYILEQPYGKGAYILPEPRGPEESMSESGGPHGGPIFGDKDPLFAECARYVVMAQTASASSLQRRYSIGYNRAGKIMDQMEALGIVGPTTGGKPRDVLIDSVALESLLSANGL